MTAALAVIGEIALAAACVLTLMAAQHAKHLKTARWLAFVAGMFN